MANIKVTCGMAMSLDGVTAGFNLSEDRPFGDFEPDSLFRWMFTEPEKHQAVIDNLNTAGAFIMGRNMFGPRGPEYDKTWKGWWGDEPPYHAPVFVLTETPRESFDMQGGTSFTFVTDGLESALERAKKVAMQDDLPEGRRGIVSIAGGAHTVNQCLKAGLVDELWLSIVPVTLGTGIRLFEDVPGLRLEPLEFSGDQLVTHIRYRVQHD